MSDLLDYDKLIILDVVSGGMPPESIYRFGMDDVQDSGAMVSLHDLGVVDSLKLENLVGRIPEDIVFFGIEPQKIELSIGLSSPVKECLSYLAQKVLEEIHGNTKS